VKCRWFDISHRSLSGLDGSYGYCRKHKPLVFQLADRHYGGWPLVDADDLCGEFHEDVKDGMPI
jgi:hypothetical protein